MAAATYQAEQMGRRKGFDKEPSSKTIIHGHGYSIYLYLYIYIYRALFGTRIVDMDIW